MPIARSATVQAFTAARLFGITALDLSPAVVDEQLQSLELQVQGIRSADALHLTTAIRTGADIFVSTDSVLTRLDKKFLNCSGNPMTVCDSDVALGML